MAAAYERVGDVQGGDFSANLGDTAGALRSYRKALELREALLAADPASAEARREATLSHDKLGVLLEGTGDVTGAAADMRAAVGLAPNVPDRAPQDRPASPRQLSGLEPTDRWRNSSVTEAGGCSPARLGCDQLSIWPRISPGMQRLLWTFR